jgi:hypothetical protein
VYNFDIMNTQLSKPEDMFGYFTTLSTLQSAGPCALEFFCAKLYNLYVLS